MAAIDNIYVNSYEKYKEFEKWLLEQPKLKDKYGKEVSIYSYFFDLWDNPKYWINNSHPIFSAPCYVDAYIIRNCPLDYIQRDLMLNYGHKTQEDINEMYDTVINRTSEDQKLIDDAKGEYPNKPISYWWLNKEDFKIIDGVITLSNLKKSSYQKILDGELYTSPSNEGTYEVGKHFKIIRKPFYQNKCNYPMSYIKNGVKRCPEWDVSVINMWWHSKNKIGTWDSLNEFVVSENLSSTSFCPSLKSIKRRILKWKLPVGTIIILNGMYVGEYYKIIVKK